MLTELKIKNAKARDKKFLISDGRGLYLRVDPNGRKYFIFRFWEMKKERQFCIGAYPDLSLKDARIKRDELQNKRKSGEVISNSKIISVNLFADAADEWLKVRMSDKAPGYLKAVNLRLKKIYFAAFRLKGAKGYKNRRDIKYMP